ncbi:uncharacterized protein LOC134290405 [Aedes albopictus]|uniref:Secreted protein n=1 Tax=Aedes albopictus TaxID=7160 RepID=A0ABM1Y9A5_AEDAL
MIDDGPMQWLVVAQLTMLLPSFGAKIESQLAPCKLIPTERPLLRDGATACKASGLHNYTSLAKPRARNLNTTSFSSLDCNESHGHTVPKTAIVIFGNQKTWLVNRHDLRRPKSWDRKCRPIIHIEKCWIQIPKRQHAVEDSDESATAR